MTCCRPLLSSTDTIRGQLVVLPLKIVSFAYPVFAKLEYLAVVSTEMLQGRWSRKLSGIQICPASQQLDNLQLTLPRRTA